MRIGPTFNVAYRALRRNKMRSVLTALGIIIGVGAVIAMVGIGNGAKAQVEAQIGASAYKKTCSAGGIYPTTRFRDNSLTVSMPGPGRHNCTIYLRTK